MRWHGYQLYLHLDVNHELPIAIRLTAAHESEHRHCTTLVEEFLGSQLSDRTLSFVADRGLDNDRLRRRLFDNGALPVIEEHHLWKDTNPHPDQLHLPTRPMRQDRIDTITNTEFGDNYCMCPQIGLLRLMQFQVLR